MCLLDCGYRGGEAAIRLALCRDRASAAAQTVQPTHCKSAFAVPNGTPWQPLSGGMIDMNRVIVFAFALACLVAFSVGALADSFLYIAFYQSGNTYFARRIIQTPPGPELAVAYLMLGPTVEEEAIGVTTRIPAEWAIESMRVEDGYLVIDLRGARTDTHYPDELIDDIIYQFDRTVRPFDLNARLLVGGEPISVLRYPQPEIIPRVEPVAPREQLVAGRLAGKKIVISAGHGYYWSGSSWLTQRPVTCGDLQKEDFRNVDHAILLKAYLEAEGATVIDTREMNKSRGMSPYGYHWWQMSGPPYLHNKGYPASVYAPYTGVAPGTAGVDQRDEDRRSRPNASNYDGAHAYISLHTNALTGECYGSGCPTGIDMYHSSGKVGTASYTFADNLQDNCSAAVRTYFDPTFACRNGCNPRDTAFTEIHYPTAPACLLEYGFHDTCDRDALFMRDPLFTSAGMYGLYRGVCQYFGVTPSYDGYSAEYVSDTIPTEVTQGETQTVYITLRNRGVTWSEGHQFRLGAVGDSDPFAGTRHTITGTVSPGQTYTFAINMTFLGLGNQVTDWRMVRDGVAWFGDTVSKTVHVTASDDTEPPTVPQNLRVTASTLDSITLAWDASTDNRGVIGYRIYRDGSPLTTTPNTTYTDTGLSANTNYNYQVQAYDAVPNYSALSSVLSGMTTASMFSDGFDGSLSNWILDTAVANNNPLEYSTAQNHGSLPGAGSAYAASGVPRFMYHWLDSSTESLTAGGYKTGTFSAWLYDTQGAMSGLRTGLRVYAYDSGGVTRAIYWIGTYNGNPPNLATHYIAAVWDGTWTYYDLGMRTVNWHKFSIEVLPYAGSSDVRFTVDGNSVAASQPSAAANANLKRVYIGYNYNPNANHYYDDITFDSVAPLAPSGVSGAGVSESAIRWSFTDNSDNEIGFRVYDGAAKRAQSELPNIGSVDESGLPANTVYTRTLKAYAGALESPASGQASACTLSVPPSTSTITCSKPVGVWQNQNPFQFTAVGGFGPGKVSYYRYAWDQSPTHTWTGEEWVWAATTTSRTATTSTSPWYLHVQGFNEYGQPNGTLDLGPYYFDGTPPSQPVVIDDGATTTSASALHASWSASDGESGVISYQYAIGTTPGAADVVGWTTPSPENATEVTHTGLSLQAGSTYYISAKALNAAQLWSSVGTSDGITVQIPEVSILEAKARPDGSSVTITGRVVSAAFDGSFYIQETGRVIGIRVVSGVSVQVGDKVDVTGALQTIDGERRIAAASVTVH